METRFASHKQHLFSLLYYRNAKKTCTDQSILHVFYSVWKETIHQPLQIEAEVTHKLLQIKAKLFWTEIGAFFEESVLSTMQMPKFHNKAVVMN